MRYVFSTVLLIAALPVTAQIYQYTDDNGNSAYTDQPPFGVPASSVELSTINSVPTNVRQPASSILNTDSVSKHKTLYSLLQMNGLPTDQAIRANNGSFTVQVEISPNLAKQHRLQLLIDGKAYGTASTATTLQIENIDRGEHRLAVQVLADDKVIQRSAEQTINVQRVHINRPKPSTP